MAQRIPFNKPFISGNELQYVTQAISEGKIASDGHFTKSCAACWKRRSASARCC